MEAVEAVEAVEVYAVIQRNNGNTATVYYGLL